MRTCVPTSPVRTYTAICSKRTLYSRSPSESPLHFADRRAESVIVGYYTSAEVPFPRRRQPECAFVNLFCAANPHRPQGDVSRDSKGCGSPVATSKCLHFEALDRADRRETAPWHTDFGTKSSVLHLARGVHALPVRTYTAIAPNASYRVTTKFAQSELDSAKQKAGYHYHSDTLPLLVYRSE